ncbi:MAG: hypothetical protein MUC58_01955 [Rhizobiaceae bacterium]|nr:hypothetical protein [Rhizobiaceae bacterium]
MADASQTAKPASSVIPLDDAIREARSFAADRADVVVDLRDAARARIELLAEELGPTVRAVPADDDQFDFAISSGQNPRLFIDATTHVALGRDRMTYRFVRDTRLGRVVMEESRDLKTVADKVTRYVAERIVEKRRAVDGEVTSLRGEAASPAKPQDDGVSDFVLGLVWFLIGAVAGAGGLYLAVSGALTGG